MEFRTALKNQYHASLGMLRQSIERCPEDVWLSGMPPRSFWRIAYHTLFYTHLYLQPTSEGFQAWEHHEQDIMDLWGDEIKAKGSYTKEQALEYWAICEAMVDEAVDSMNLDAEESGFSWYPMPKVEHQLVNLRHIQQHVGQLSELLMAVGIDTDWYGRRRP